MDEPFLQSDAIRDFVFPLFDSTRSAEGLAITRFLGSGFFVGSQNLAMTARHVLAGAEEPVAGLVRGASWEAFSVLETADHPTEDVTIFRLQPPSSTNAWKSISRASAEWVGSSAPYMLWGYPLDAATELVENGFVQLRPDLVYSEGHVRRRLSRVPLPGIRGNHFLELSTVAGAGFSGSPVYLRRPAERWDLIGVYVGEKVTEGHGGVGYAVRLSELSDWQTGLAGGSVMAAINL